MKKSFYYILCVLFILSFFLSSCSITGSSDDDSDNVVEKNSLGILVPAYFYPAWWDSQTNLWDDLALVASDIPIIAIMNPNSGPGTAQNTDYQTAITTLQQSGGQVIGYVHTSYGERDIDTCKQEIDNYYDWYSDIDGIFFDEMDNNTNDIDYYKSLYNYVLSKEQQAIVIGNPGINTEAEYLSAATGLVIFENNSGYAAWSPDQWIENYSSDKFAVLLYNIDDENTMKTNIDLAISRNIGWLYLTDDILPNPWDTLPSYWEEEVSYIQSKNS